VERMPIKTKIERHTTKLAMIMTQLLL